MINRSLLRKIGGPPTNNKGGLTKLRDVQLKINAKKSDFFAEETEYLGYTLTKKVQTTDKKVQAILA